MGLIIVLLLAAFPLRARGESEYERTRRELVVRLEALGAWCAENGLYARRQRVAEHILVFDEDHAGARDWLRHRRHEGRWVAREPAHVAKDRNSAAGKRYSDRRAALLAPTLDALAEMLDESAVISPLQRERLASDLVRIAPDDARLRRLAGEVQDDGRWVLPETALARKRRPWLRALAVGFEKQLAEPELDKPTNLEWRTRIRWTGAYRVGHARATGTVRDHEIREAARLAATAGALFREVTGSKRTLSEQFTVYVFADRDIGDRFLLRHPNMDAKARARAALGNGLLVPLSWDVVVRDPARRRRAELVTRHTLGSLFRDEYGAGTLPGWITEGLGARLTEDVVGSKLTWLVPNPRFAALDEKLANALYVPGANWRRTALEWTDEHGPPDLARITQREIQIFEPLDSLFSYALVSFLLEGRPKALPAVLEEVANGRGSLDAIREATDLDPPLLQERLLRWLRESDR